MDSDTRLKRASFQRGGDEVERNVTTSASYSTYKAHEEFRGLSIAIGLVVLLLGLAASALAQSGTHSNISEYQIPTAASDPEGITMGPDGALWFTESYLANKIGRMTLDGVVTGEYLLPNSQDNPNPRVITLGPDGALWFPEFYGGRIGRITIDGEISEYPVPDGSSKNPFGITAGPDGALWFTEEVGNNIGRITTDGVITEYQMPNAGTRLTAITQGPDGALWFTESSVTKIGRITTGGVITEYTVPGGYGDLYGITVGPDGALWFTEFLPGKIGRMTTTGVVTQYLVPTSGSQPWGITAGPDGALWFTEYSGNKIGRITTRGIITEYPLTANSGAKGVTAGSDGDLWLVNYLGSDIDRAPACGLGFSASFANGTLTTKFVLGINTPAIFGITVHSSTGWQNLFSKPLQPVVPPKPLTATWTFPSEGNVTVKSALTTTTWHELCSEWATVNTAP